MVYAHAIGQSHLFLRIHDDAIEGRVEMTVDDLNLALGLNMPTEGQVTENDLAPHIDQIRAYITDRLSMNAAGTPYTLRYTGYGILDVNFAKFAMIYFVIEDLPGVPEKIDIDYNLLFDVDPNQTGLLVIEHNWYTGTLNNEAIASLSFGPDRTRETLDLSGATKLNGFLSFIRLGSEHILIGLDHILFLAALLLPAVLIRRDGRWEVVPHFRTALINVIKIVTLFTVAHSITLSLAALDLVRLPGRLVESVIALSIGVAALDMIFPIFGRRIWLVIFGFGLFHGFGFAEVLTDLGLEGVNMALSLLGFNLGVELGQVLIICIFLPVLYGLRHLRFYPTYILQASSMGLILIALYWSIERIFNYELHARVYLKQLVDLVLPT